MNIHTGELTQNASTHIWHNDIKPHMHTSKDFSFTSLLAWSTFPNWHPPSPPGLYLGVHHAQVTHPMRLEEVIREWVSGLWQLLTPGSHALEPEWLAHTAIRLPWLMLKVEAFFFYFCMLLGCAWWRNAFVFMRTWILSSARPLSLLILFLSQLHVETTLSFWYLGGSHTCNLHHLLDSHRKWSLLL